MEILSIHRFAIEWFTASHGKNWEIAFKVGPNGKEAIGLLRVCLAIILKGFPYLQNICTVKPLLNASSIDPA